VYKTITELAHKIHKYLTEEKGYKIWIDREEIHGSTIDAMAGAVEKSKFILMCMSEIIISALI
ncbi:unnamed protein product, partial [Didymodactylos carnosus]